MGGIRGYFVRGIFLGSGLLRMWCVACGFWWVVGGEMCGKAWLVDGIFVDSAVEFCVALRCENAGFFASLRMTSNGNSKATAKQIQLATSNAMQQQQQHATERNSNGNSNSRSPSGMTSKKGNGNCKSNDSDGSRLASGAEGAA